MSLLILTELCKSATNLWYQTNIRSNFVNWKGKIMIIKYNISIYLTCLLTCSIILKIFQLFFLKEHKIVKVVLQPILTTLSLGSSNCCCSKTSVTWSGCSAASNRLPLKFVMNFNPLKWEINICDYMNVIG